MCRSKVTSRAQSTVRLTCLILVVAAAAALRGYCLDWDNGLLFHPDEANLIRATERVSVPGQLDPDFFAYNGFPIYLYRVATNTVALFRSSPDWGSRVSNIVLVGRALSALFSTLSVAAIFFLGCLVADRRVGFWASTFLAFNVGMIQTAHFAVTENLMVLLLILLSIVTIKTTRDSKDFLGGSWLVGLLLGLALGAKTTALAYFCIPVLAVMIGWLGEQKRSLRSLRGWIPGGVVALVIAVTTFFFVSPYSLLRYADFRSSMDFEWEVVSGKRDIFYTMQFYGKRDYWFPFLNLHWLCGPMLPSMGVVGMSFWLAALVRRRSSLKAIPFLAFGALYFLYVGHWHAKFVRYTLLMIPCLCLSAAWGVCHLQQCMKKSAWRILPAALISGSCIVWSAMFFTIYLRPDTRLSASQWIANHVQAGSHLLYEVGDHPVLPQPISAQLSYSIEGMRIYDSDSVSKRNEFARQLATADYLVLASPRFYGILPSLPLRYPMTAKYYKALFDGELGYTVCATFDSKPTLGTWQIDDGIAEETFSVFDHPTVLILEKSATLTSEQISEAIRSVNLKSIPTE